MITSRKQCRTTKECEERKRFQRDQKRSLGVVECLRLVIVVLLLWLKDRLVLLISRSEMSEATVGLIGLPQSKSVDCR